MTADLTPEEVQQLTDAIKAGKGTACRKLAIVEGVK